MTEKQKIFADEYLMDLNGTRAYKVAYPNVKKDSSASAAASRLLDKEEIFDYIQERLKELEDKRVAKQQEVMEYLTDVLRGKSESDVIRLDGDGYQKVVKKGPDEKERLKAAELLGKRYKMWTDKLEVKNEGEEKKQEAISNIEAMLKQMTPVEEDDISE